MAVSSTSVYGFKYEQSLAGNLTPVSLDFIIANSQTITIGDAVRLNTSGYVKRCAAGDPVLGIVQGLVTRGGINIFSPRVPATDITGVTLTPGDTIAVSSTNQSDTTRNVKAQIVLNPAGDVLWRNQADVALTQANVGQLFDIGSVAGQISQASASNTSGQFQLVALDATTSTVGLFRIVECQLATVAVDTYNSTAIIAA